MTLALATTSDPAGRAVVVLDRIWHGKIVGDHPEMAGRLDAVVATIKAPDHVADDARVGRVRYYRRRVGPSRWLLAVVSYEQEPARLITALGTRKDPPAWSA